MPPVRPMLAKSVKGIPDPAKYVVDGVGGLSFEPKWDGFRCLVFKDGDEVELASRNTKPLTRYFPEVVAAMREQLPDRCVLDGEIFVALRGDDGVDRLEFETLQERIHPAKSRIDMLAEKTPAGWTYKGMLGHVANWMEKIPAEMPNRLAGRRGPTPDVDADQISFLTRHGVLLFLGGMHVHPLAESQIHVVDVAHPGGPTRRIRS